MADYIQTPGGVIVPANFAEEKKPIPPPDFNEVATTRDGRDITRGYVDSMMQLLPQDSVLALRGNYNYDLYREVLRDDQVKATFDQRRLSVIKKEWAVTPGGGRPIDIEAADFLKDQLKRINFDNVTDKMLYSVFYGYGIAEVLWEDRAPYTFWKIRVRDRRRFVFDIDMQARLLTMTNTLPGEKLGERKFWILACGADHDDEPYGLGLAHWLYWPVFFKRGGLKLWLTFLDKFGTPTAKGEYPGNATYEEKQKLLAALRAITSESGVIVPEGMAIDLIEAARSGTTTHTDLYDRMNAAITKVIVCQVGTTDGTPGKLGNNAEQEAIFQAITKADADLVCGSFNNGPVRWLTDYNFPGAAYPEVWRVVDEGESLNDQAKRDEMLVNAGYRPTLERVQEVYGEGYELIPGTQPPPQPNNPGDGTNPPDTPDFAEVSDALRPRDIGGDIDQMEAEAEAQAGKQWEKLMRKRVDQLIALAEDSGDLVTFRERLDELAAEPPDQAAVEEFRNVGFAGRLWGRWRGTRGEF